MRFSLAFRLARAMARPIRPQQQLLARPVLSAPTSTLRPFSSTSIQFKKSKAAAVKRAHKEAKEEADENPESHRYEKAAENDLDDVLDKTRRKMEKSLDWAKAIVYEAVERGRGRVTPALLDGVKLETPDVPGSRSLNSVASVTVKGTALYVEVWDEDHFKHVESAINLANLPGISPNKIGATTLKLPVTRPLHEQRQAILKNLGKTIETAKNQVRKARTEGHNMLGGRGEPGTDEVEKLAGDFAKSLDASLTQAKEEFKKV